MGIASVSRALAGVTAAAAAAVLLNHPPSLWAQGLASQPMSNQQVAGLNERARTLEGELREIDIQLHAIDEMLRRQDRGDYIVFVGGFWQAMTEAELTRVLDQHRFLDRSTEVNPFVMGGLDNRIVLDTYRGESRRLGAQLLERRPSLFRRRAEILGQLDQIRRSIMADASRPGSAYDPNAQYSAADNEPNPSLAWDTRITVHGIECFNGVHHKTKLYHFHLNGRFVGVDRTDYDRVRSQAAAGGARFCGSWEVSRDTMTKGAGPAGGGNNTGYPATKQ